MQMLLQFKLKAVHYCDINISRKTNYYTDYLNFSEKLDDRIFALRCKLYHGIGNI